MEQLEMSLMNQVKMIIVEDRKRQQVVGCVV